MRGCLEYKIFMIVTVHQNLLFDEAFLGLGALVALLGNDRVRKQYLAI